MTLIRRVPRIIRKHKMRYLGLTLLVALGSIALITLNLITSTLQHSFDRLSQEGKVEDARAWLTSITDDLAVLEDTFKVELEPRISFDTSFASGVTLRVFDRSERVDKPVILNGRDLAANDEVLLNPAFAFEQSLKIGDQITLLGKSWRVCGFFSLPDYIYPTKQETDLMTDPRHFGIAIISKAAVQSIAAAREMQSLMVDQSLAVRFLPGHGDIKSEFTKKYGLARWLEKADNPRINMVKGELGGLREMTATIPIAIFLINCALLASILWRMVRLEFPFIGTLRAMGLGRSEILRHYLVIPSAIAITGSVIGTAGGLLLARPILVYYATFFNLPVDRTQIDPVLMLSSILIPIILILATACFVILRALRLTPLNLIRGYKRRPKAMKLEKRIRFHNIRFATKFRIRQTVRSSGKMFIAIIGVACASMLLLLGFLVQDSYTFLLDTGMRQTFRYEFHYVFKEVQLENPYGGEKYQLLTGKDITRQEAVLVQGLAEDGQMIHLVDRHGLPVDPASTVVSRVLADKMKLKIGDTISWVDDLEGKTYSFQLGAIAEVYTVNAIYLPLTEFNRIFESPTGSFTGLYSSSNLQIPSQKLYQTERMDEVLQSFETYAGVMKVTLLGLGILSSLMSLLILYILIALLIEENSQSIALLKILGYDAREIRSLILRTFDIPVLIGFAISIPLLFSLFGRMIESSFQEIDMTMPLRLSPWYLATGFVILYSTYLITRTLSGKKIFRISMADGLKKMQE